MAILERHLTDGSGIYSAFEENRPMLMRFLIARGASHPEAEDIVQDLLVKLLEQRTGPISDPKAYLFKMAHNQFIDRRRSAVQRMRREEHWTEASSGSGEADPHPSIETTLIDREALGLVQSVLAELPDRTRDILRRYRIDGEGQKAIATALGISISAVEKHLQRAYRAVLDARKQIDAGNVTQLRLSAREHLHDD
jgi:RNA polymerase sigma-70 factor (ECF subfamily)